MSGAIIFYRLALKLEPNDLEIHSRLQEALNEKKQQDEQIASYRQNIAKNPQMAHNYSELGNILADLGEEKKAIALHRQGSFLRGWHLALESRQYQFRYDWFTHNIPIWQKHLKPFAHKPGLAILEIGSFEGMASCWLLDYILTEQSAKITCIDMYFQDNFDFNVAQTGALAKVTKLMGNSHEILPTLKSQHYDIVYIDGSHLADDVRKDATLAWNLVKDGGLIIFDDYEWIDLQQPEIQQPKHGINAFLNDYIKQITILHQGYQIISQKIIPN